MAKIIVLDAGHGQFGNPYPTFDGCYEGTQNYKLSLKLKRELEVRGYEVLLTRPEITDDPELAVRGRMAGEHGACFFLSLHSNAPGNDVPPDIYPTIRGTEIYYSLTDKEGNIPLARALNDAVVRVMETEDRGIKIREYPGVPEDDYYGVLRSSAKSGCRRAMLLEHGFHTNPEDAAKLLDDAILERLAVAEAEVIARFV
ncbi:MAG: N-acetylmuramoyl-L-alanine amidase [Clostridia bacterium]|nr:N-acetylmuramoyl-L-alanine amidase [Clostridia bacterium]